MTQTGTLGLAGVPRRAPNQPRDSDLGTVPRELGSANAKCSNPPTARTAV
jgi:hypothetical protein